MQPQGHLQVVSALLDDQVDPQTVVDLPRFCIEEGRAGGKVALEQGVPDEVCNSLESMGHPIRKVSGYERTLFGRGQMIVRDSYSKVLWGGSDPRADGCAMGL